MQVFNVDGHEVIVVNGEGKFYAISNRCPRLNYALYLGSFDSYIIICGFHYAKFDVTNGKVLNPPAPEPFKTYKVKTVGSAILVELE
jgi:nitrite reductase/ring-hydroxylating ferredoxin subunit